ncbi:MAG: hypothetical protein NTV68_12540 [Methanomicrobiales archaeon]|nr:hypothetical protein [Methanomicrobiales archaeon]
MKTNFQELLLHDRGFLLKISITLIIVSAMAFTALAAPTDTSGSATTTFLSPAYTQVTVSDLTLDPGTFATGDEGTITVVVQNTGTQSVTIRRATLYDKDITLVSTTTYDSVGSIGAGNKMPFTFTVKADVPEGIYYPVFSLEFQDTGYLRYPVKLEVKNSPVVLSITDKPDTFVAGKKSIVTLSLSNLRTNAIKNVIVSPNASDIEIIPQNIVINSLDPGQTVKLPFSITPKSPNDIDFEAVYLNGPNIHQVGLILPIQFNNDKTQADPVISNIVSAPDGNHIRITGDVTNSGLQDAKSVTVASGSPAIPVDPFKVYAVGLLKPDDFSSFELTVSSESPDEVPVIVSYKDQDGNMYSRSIAADISLAKTPKNNSSMSNAPWIIVGIIAVIVVLAIGYRYIRTRKP